MKYFNNVLIHHIILLYIRNFAHKKRIYDNVSRRNKYNISDIKVNN